MPPRRPKGGIDRRPNGALRVRVYAGIDPVSKKRHYLIEHVPPGPKAEQVAETVRQRLTRDVEERRHPRTSATLNQLLDKHLEMMVVEESTRRTYVGYVDKHIRPLIGAQRIGAVDAAVLDSFYRELRRCRDHCAGGRSSDRDHACKPLAPWTIRKIHFILSGAYRRAVRWKWVGHNPVAEADPPAAPQPDPQPPTADEAARLLTAAWQDADFGPLVWTAMTTGARRGELCALRWRDFDAERRVLVVQRSVGQDGAETWEKDTKTHQRRNVALDTATTEILVAYRQRCDARAATFGELLAESSYLFSSSPDGGTGWKPASVTQRYDRMAARLSIDTTFHKLRHYSATELITSGVDVRTVAGRLGHSGGGTTTLKVYAAWVSEADQRASAALLNRMPRRPAPPPLADARAMTDPKAPYERIAAELRAAILSDAFTAGEPLPPIIELADRYNVAVGTVHRAIALLKDWNLVEASRGRRVIVLPQPESSVVDHADRDEVHDASHDGPRELLDLELIRNGQPFRRLSAEADPSSASELKSLLADAIRRAGLPPHEIRNFEMNVRFHGERGLVTTFVAGV